MNAAPPVTNLLYRLFPDRIKKPGPDKEASAQELSDHIIIVGFGMTGKSVARAAEILGIPYNAIDMDPDVVRREQAAEGHPGIYFGDATHREILEHAGIQRARALVVVISEQNVVPGIIHLAREMSPEIYIVVRTRHVNDVQNLLDLGADEVIPEEFETSVRIFARVLAKYTLPENDIDTLTKIIRSGGYRMFTRATSRKSAGANNPGKALEDLHIHTLQVTKSSEAAGKTLRELDAWNTYGIGVLAVRRSTSAITAPGPDLRVQPGDYLILYGADENLKKFLPQIGNDTTYPPADHKHTPSV
jgi:CPA2 family monovalent cation:H+ antiporter-2